MKKTLFILAITALVSSSIFAQTKKDGTPDMRYKANKQTIAKNYPTPTYSTPKVERNYSEGGQYKIQSGYQKNNGTYVAPHLKTKPDNKTYNNYKQKNK